MADTRPTASFQQTRSQQQETDMDRVAVRGKKSESLKNFGIRLVTDVSLHGDTGTAAVEVLAGGRGTVNTELAEEKRTACGC
ncbi:hypothetical protein NDU88_003083 [Pleurodeles waltl]|uniref:Uncharacterized protein n=1 Tax=Pleurodeles waltl TaxID=8319 RepID=A0AAV7M629_PLEWA|nr:hypothetical protein NDU88_003083 [Pleurodeles waltl]